MCIPVRDQPDKFFFENQCAFIVDKNILVYATVVKNGRQKVTLDSIQRQMELTAILPLRYLFAAHPQAMGKVLGIVYRAISIYLSMDCCVF
ncbi:MAG: hypothetical protein ACI8SI_003312 [Congregibacter sp.]